MPLNPVIGWISKTWSGFEVVNRWVGGSAWLWLSVPACSHQIRHAPSSFTVRSSSERPGLSSFVKASTEELTGFVSSATVGSSALAARPAMCSSPSAFAAWGWRGPGRR